MREIRFRAWDKLSKTMCIVTEMLFSPESKLLNVDLSNGACRDISDIELMEYTGLLDCKGKEIYEGDIVQEYGGGKRKATIEWIELDCAFAVQTGKPEIHTISRHTMEYGDIEVIGNIYGDIKQGGN